MEIFVVVVVVVVVSKLYPILKLEKINVKGQKRTN